ncbi:MAG TPA: CheR family methyltransferase [Polyangiaceae bacterium]
MTLIAQVTEELSRAAGLRVQTEWAPAIRAVVEKYAEGTGSQSLDAEARRFLLSEVARHVTVPETYFFRNLAQLTFCAEHAAGVLRHSGSARIWCAGAATGEEPYSLAMLLYRSLGAKLGASIEIRASDLNPEAIEKAQHALYTAWSFRGAPSWCFRFFTPEAEARLRLTHPEVRTLVSFRTESCQAAASHEPAQSLDVISFRNVAIYLEEAAIQALYIEFSRLLKPGGLLALGPSDPRPIGSDFELLGHYDHAPVFVRTQREPSLAAAPTRPAAAPRPCFRAELARRPLGTAPRSEPPPERAVEVVQALAAAAPSDTTAQRLLGLAHLERNATAEAVAALRQAVFLDPTDALSRYFYALALHENRDTARAARQLATVIDDLQLRAADDMLADGSTSALELLRSARFLRTQWQ